jgi:ABC-type transporter Mla subunit MlaD
MADTGPAGPLPRDPFENLISIVAGPIAAVIRSFDQLRRGSDELLNGLENFNRTMENLNVTAERVNGLLNEFEEPVRAILPQVMRTVNLAEDVANRVSAPIDQVVPGLTRLADTLNSPIITSLPADLGRFVEAINDLIRRLAPLGLIAESAGGLFGLRLPGMPRTSPAPMLPVAEEPTEAPPVPKKAAAAKKAAPKKAAAPKKTAAPKKKGRPKKTAKRSPPR